MNHRACGAFVAILALSACGGGGGGVNSASSCSFVTTGPCTTPPPDPGSSTPAPVPLFEGDAAATYTAVGGAQKLVESYFEPDGGGQPARGGELYTAGQLPLASKTVAISYDPRNAVFSVEFNVEDIDVTPRFQDPAHRTDFGPNLTPQGGVPDLPQLAYLESGSATATSVDVQTFFYETPGTKTRYVTLAGYVRNFRDGALDSDFKLDRTRGAGIFGNLSRVSDVPKTGSATYAGNMLASLVSIDLDPDPSLRSRFEWVNGTASTAVNFGTGTVTTSFQGTVVPTASAFEGAAFGTMSPANSGATFSAAGSAKFDATGTGYAGKIDSASFAGSGITIAASSMDGAFFGPGAVETGGAFRVIGATPDQRVDFIGAFTGVK